MSEWRLEQIKTQHAEHDMSDSDEAYLLGLVIAAGSALREARKWIGDGNHSDGLARDHWTQEYKDVVDLVDRTLATVDETA